LTNKECAATHDGICLAVLSINQGVLRLDDGAGLALVVDAHDPAADLEPAAGRGGGKRLEEGHLALAVDDAARVELGDAGDGLGRGAGVEVDDILVRVLEGEDDGVGGEDGEAWMELLGAG
jgi:hypothetical protein